MKRSRPLIFAVLGGLVLLVCLAALVSGAYRVPAGEVFRLLFFPLSPGSGSAATVILDIRLPRLFTALLVGLGLSVSGTVFQGLFRNPLVEPYILGVSSGAAFGAALSIVLSAAVFPLHLTSFVCGMGAMALALLAAGRRGTLPIVNLILAGVVINSLFSAGLSFLKLTAGARELRELTFWLMGGLYVADRHTAGLLAVQVLPAALVIWSQGWKLNVLSAGEEEALTLGLRVKFLRGLLMILAAYVTSLCVAAVGIVAWVGLMMPHIARMLIGPDHRVLIPASALLGAGFLTLCDTLARTVTGGEIPVSIITAFLGAPYLLFLIRTNRRVGFAG